jgi:hypothetical protein
MVAIGFLLFEVFFFLVTIYEVPAVFFQEIPKTINLFGVLRGGAGLFMRAP